MLAVPAVASTERRPDLRTGASLHLSSFMGLMARQFQSLPVAEICGQGCAQ